MKNRHNECLASPLAEVNPPDFQTHKNPPPAGPVQNHLPLGRLLLILATVLIAGSGCATKNVDPAVARRHTGYVDFYAVNDDDLCWEIVELKHNREIVREFKPATDHILRYAFRPGDYEFRISYLNRVVPEAGVVKVVVRDGMVTPVSVTLVETGTAQVETKEVRVGGTWYGRYGRSTKFSNNEAGIFQLKVESADPLPYRTKAGVPYAELQTH
jgi:hypothetical protein